MTGGGIGAGLRYLCGRWALALFGPGYPWGTLSVNIAGSLAMGLLAGVLARTGGSEQIRLFIGVGLLGGFTTFSALSLELSEMLLRGALPTALAYAAISITAGVAGLWIAIHLVRAAADRKSTRLNSSHYCASRMPPYA